MGNEQLAAIGLILVVVMCLSLGGCRAALKDAKESGCTESHAEVIMATAAVAFFSWAGSIFVAAEFIARLAGTP